ncbi:hypothetical protein PQX77_003948 [Marasmius sp. AFHP31]|nr:hypothetical protein PQX77_003948 [Marasmius sp. AFHP31]
MEYTFGSNAVKASFADSYKALGQRPQDDLQDKLSAHITLKRPIPGDPPDSKKELKMTYDRSYNMTWLSSIRSLLASKSSTEREQESMMETCADEVDFQEEHSHIHRGARRMPFFPLPHTNKTLPPLPADKVRRSQTQTYSSFPRTRMRTLSHRDSSHHTHSRTRPRTISHRNRNRESIYHPQNLHLGKEFYLGIFCFLGNAELVAVAMSCKALRDIAYQVLYNTVVLVPRRLPPPCEILVKGSQRLPSAFYNLLLTLQTNRIARAQIRHLSIYSGIEVPKSAYDWLKRLETPLLSLDVRMTPGSDDEHLINTILRCPALKTLRSFTHSGDPMLFRNVERLSLLLSSTPKLKRLAVTLPNQLGKLETLAPSFPSSSVEHAIITSPKFDATLRQLLLSLSGSVRALELSISHPIASEIEARNTLYALGAGLRELALQLTIPPADYRFLDDAPEHLTSLRGIYLSRGTCTKELLNNLHHASGLEYLGLAGCVPDIIPTQDLVKYVSKRGNPELTSLYLYPEVREGNNVGVVPNPSVALLEACREVKVKLKRSLGIPGVFNPEKAMASVWRSKPIFVGIVSLINATIGLLMLSEG